jgi:hypothetical protein
MDYCSMPAIGDNWNTVLIFIDRLTKIIRLIPTHDTVDATETARLFINHWYKDFGLPEGLVSDRDPRLTSEVWRKVMEILQVDHKYVNARHQRGNGQAETTVGTIKNILTSYSNYEQTNWIKMLPLVEFAYNDSVNMSTGFTPFYLMNGRHPRALPTIEEPEDESDLMTTISSALDVAKDRIKLAQDRYAEAFNRKRSSPLVYKVGSQVLLKRDGITWEADYNKENKLLPRYLGPFRITAVNGDHCTLELPASLKGTHPTFHQELLRPYLEPSKFFPPDQVTYRHPRRENWKWKPSWTKERLDVRSNFWYIGRDMPSVIQPGNLPKT